MMGGAMLSKSLIQFPVDGWGYVPSLLFDLRPNYPESNEDNGNFLQKILCMHCHRKPQCGECLRLEFLAWESVGQLVPYITSYLRLQVSLNSLNYKTEQVLHPPPADP